MREVLQRNEKQKKQQARQEKQQAYQQTRCLKAKRRKVNKRPVTVDSLVQQKKAIEAQIEALRLQEAAELEAKRLKVQTRQDRVSILIAKGSEKMILHHDDAFELVDRLTEYLTALPATVPSRQ